MGWFADNHPCGENYEGGYSDFDDEYDSDNVNLGHLLGVCGNSGSDDSDGDCADPYALEMEREKSDEYDYLERSFLQMLYPQLFSKPTSHDPIERDHLLALYPQLQPTSTTTTDVIDVDEDDDEDDDDDECTENSQDCSSFADFIPGRDVGLEAIREELVVPVIVKMCSHTWPGNRHVCADLVRLALAHFGVHQRWRVIEALVHGAFPLRVLTQEAQQIDPRAALDYETPILEKCLPNNDVLFNVFGYFPHDMRLLVSVSGVCRSWRERSASLPQWESRQVGGNPPYLRPSWGHRMRCGLHGTCHECGVRQREHPCPYRTCKRQGRQGLIHDVTILENDVQKHQQLHACAMCPTQQFPTVEEQRLHHRNVHMFVCHRGCNVAFETAEECSSHGVVCEICITAKFCTERLKNSHIASAHRTHKPKPQKPSVQKPQVSVMCRPCNRGFGSHGALLDHNKAKHSGKSVPVAKSGRSRNNIVHGVQVKREGGHQSLPQNRAPTKRGRSPNNPPGREFLARRKREEMSVGSAIRLPDSLPDDVNAINTIDVNAKWAVMVTGRLCRSDVVVTRCGVPHGATTTVIHMKVKAV